MNLDLDWPLTRRSVLGALPSTYQNSRRLSCTSLIGFFLEPVALFTPTFGLIPLVSQWVQEPVQVMNVRHFPGYWIYFKSIHFSQEIASASQAGRSSALSLQCWFEQVEFGEKNSPSKELWSIIGGFSKSGLISPGPLSDICISSFCQGGTLE